jgi:hypothetical protein
MSSTDGSIQFFEACAQRALPISADATASTRDDIVNGAAGSGGSGLDQGGPTVTEYMQRTDRGADDG